MIDFILIQTSNPFLCVFVCPKHRTETQLQFFFVSKISFLLFASSLFEWLEKKGWTPVNKVLSYTHALLLSLILMIIIL